MHGLGFGTWILLHILRWKHCQIVRDFLTTVMKVSSYTFFSLFYYCLRFSNYKVPISQNIHCKWHSVMNVYFWYKIFSLKQPHDNKIRRLTCVSHEQFTFRWVSEDRIFTIVWSGSFPDYRRGWWIRSWRRSSLLHLFRFDTRTVTRYLFVISIFTLAVMQKDFLSRRE